jgi:hypothetical protein
MSEFNPYKLELTRAEMLEQIFQLLWSVDAIEDAKQKLMDLEEYEAWADLTVLESGLLETETKPTPPTEPGMPNGTYPLPVAI